MASHTTAPARSALLCGPCSGLASNRRPAHSLTVLSGLALALTLAGCSTPRFATVTEPELGAAVDRFDANGANAGYTAVVPRAYINAEDIDEDAPNEYTVVKDDTLWDISDRFLKQPWLWPTVWNYNPEIANPHLIYPGDKIALEYVDNRPMLVMTRNGKPLPTATMNGGGGVSIGPNGEPMLGAATEGVTRMSPRIRSESLDDAIPTIPSDAISSFLVHPRVVALETIADAPYIFGNYDRRLISALGHQVYARGDIDPSVTNYGIYRKNKELVDPVTGELLGHEILYVADAKLLAVGDPSTLMITGNVLETIAGDMLLPMDGSGAEHAFEPRLPDIRGEGRIVSLFNAITQTGRDQVVVLNLGTRSGIQVGDVLAIETRGESLIDRRGVGGYERVQLPTTRTGVLMVFKAFDKVSYGLIMESTRPVMMDDIVAGI